MARGAAALAAVGGVHLLRGPLGDLWTRFARCALHVRWIPGHRPWPDPAVGLWPMDGVASQLDRPAAGWHPEAAHAPQILHASVDERGGQWLSLDGRVEDVALMALTRTPAAMALVRASASMAHAGIHRSLIPSRRSLDVGSPMRSRLSFTSPKSFVLEETRLSDSLRTSMGLELASSKLFNFTGFWLEGMRHSVITWRTYSASSRPSLTA